MIFSIWLIEQIYFYHIIDIRDEPGRLSHNAYWKVIYDKNLKFSHIHEIAALLPSTAQQGGHTAPPHPDQEAPTATAPQHRWPTAPPPSLNPRKTPQQL